MSQLNAARITTIVNLCEPLLRTENARIALLQTLFSGTSTKPNLDTSGASVDFTHRLIVYLDNYGRLAPDKPALRALLEHIREGVGVDKQREIDDLIHHLFEHETVIPPDFVPRNPYKGLNAFGADDRDDFFGRTAFVSDLIDRLRTDVRFLAIVGASGSGKSSAVMAGLLPRLRDGNADDIAESARWVYLDPFKPGERPLENLCTALAKHLPEKALSEIIDKDLRHPSNRGLHLLAKQITKTRLVVYIDQFEELFTLTKRDDERRQFINLITTAANESEQENVVTIILTLRADFYDRPLQYAEFGALVESHHKAILPLTDADLRDVILKPAALPDVRITFDPGLVNAMVENVSDEAGALPLLQFTLDQLFQRREGLLLTDATYQALGGVRGALTKHAEATFQNLDKDEKLLAEKQLLARSIFLRLIEAGSTDQDIMRRRANLDELPNPTQSSRLNEVIDRFVNARLLTTNSVAGEDTIEVSHEALLREWKQLRDWVKESRPDLALMRRIAADCTEWEDKGKPDDVLYRGGRLREAQDWLRRGNANESEKIFIEASAKAEQKQIEAEERRKNELLEATARSKRQLRWTNISIAVALLAMIVATILIRNAAAEVDTANNKVTLAESEVAAALAERDLVLARREEDTAGLNDLYVSIAPSVTDIDVARAFCAIGITIPALEPENVLVFCEKAVDAAVFYHKDFYKDFRGIVKAQAGDFAGALEDFHAFLQYLEVNAPGCTDIISLRTEWIDQLEQGVNPFDDPSAIQPWLTEPSLDDCNIR